MGGHGLQKICPQGNIGLDQFRDMLCPMFTGIVRRQMIDQVRLADVQGGIHAVIGIVVVQEVNLGGDILNVRFIQRLPN